MNEQNQVCCICGKEINGYGNNAEPIDNGICCDLCNMAVVIPSRLAQLQNLIKADKAK